jgi:hypothetical protein
VCTISYMLRYMSDVRSQSDHFRYVRETEIGKESPELAESLIANRSSAAWKVRVSLERAGGRAYGRTSNCVTQ